MEKEFEYLQTLIMNKKQEQLSEEDKNKLTQAENLLKIKGIFFKIDSNTAIGLLNFLGVPKESMKDLYTKLISPAAFQATREKEYFVVEPESFTK